MNTLVTILAFLVGFLFICNSLNIPLSRKIYKGVIRNVDEESQTVIIVYDKKGKKIEEEFCFGDYSIGLFGMKFNGNIGTKINVMLDASGKIQCLLAPKDNNENKKKSWPTLAIGLILFGYGLYHGVFMIISFFS